MTAVDELRAVVVAGLCGGGEEYTEIHVTHADVAARVADEILRHPVVVARVAAELAGGELHEGATTVPARQWTTLLGVPVQVQHAEPHGVRMRYRPATVPEG